MIQFFNQDSTFSIESEQEISSWILNTFHKESITKKIELSIIFCSDNALLAINKQFLNHDYYTDIITFDDSLGDELIADIYISIERVEENASIYSVSFQNELYRVIVHGLLHLCGYTDKTDQALDQMRGKEDKYLAVLL